MAGRTGVTILIEARQLRSNPRIRHRNILASNTHNIETPQRELRITARRMRCVSHGRKVKTTFQLNSRQRYTDYDCGASASTLTDTPIRVYIRRLVAAATTTKDTLHQSMLGRTMKEHAACCMEHTRTKLRPQSESIRMVMSLA